MTVGEGVKKARENKGLSQTELAEMLGYKSRSSINKIEQGDRDAEAVGSSPVTSTR